MERSPKVVAHTIGVPVVEWPGNCYAVAYQMVTHGLVQGRAVYGHYLGFVAKGSLFDGSPIVRHGWVVCDDGSIVDPTRWVFEGVEPYIALMPGGHYEYDEGGNKLLSTLKRPVPCHNPAEANAKTVEGEADKGLIQLLLGRDSKPDVLTLTEAHWLATQPLEDIQGVAKHLYQLIISLGWSALIPLDNRLKIIGHSGLKT